MSYPPQPDPERIFSDIETIYAQSAEELLHAADAQSLRFAFRRALLRAYEAGIKAQRELVQLR